MRSDSLPALRGTDVPKNSVNGAIVDNRKLFRDFCRSLPVRRSVSRQLMETANNSGWRRGFRLREFLHARPAYFMGCVFVLLWVIHALGLLVLGTGRAGAGLSESILVIDNFLVLGCAWNAFRRAQGIPALFWFLFCMVVVILLTPTAIQAHDTILNTSTLSDSNRSLLYCLYGAPILMMLFLPEMHGNESIMAEVVLNLIKLV